ncbi:MAG: hypothetical protein LBK18_04480 [Prevotellaceae bacterium]|jgi:hypothetical protein|nr:hypothetical protein [Prevotellaceae bacterium]
MKVSEKYYDEIFDFKGQWDMPSKCGLKIAEKPRKTFVVVTELYQDNPGTSVTAAGHLLLDQICAAKGLNPAEVTYLECNPDTSSKLSFYDEEYFEVTFGAALPPAYRLLTKDEVRGVFDS